MGLGAGGWLPGGGRGPVRGPVRLERGDDRNRGFGGGLIEVDLGNCFRSTKVFKRRKTLNEVKNEETKFYVDGNLNKYNEDESKNTV